MSNLTRQIRTNHTEYKADLTKEILHDIASAVIKSYGPTGASTLMVTGEGAQASAAITKDGFTLISKIKYMHPAAVAMKRLILDSMIGVLKTAADGTTTTTILVDKLYSRLEPVFASKKIPAQVFQNIGKKVVNDICDAIDGLNIGNTISLEDLYGIVETTTNQDEELCKVINDVINILSNNGENFNDITMHYDMNPDFKQCKYEIKEGYTIPAACLYLPKQSTMKRKVNLAIINKNFGTSDDIKTLNKLMETVLGAMANRAISPNGVIDFDKITPLVLVSYNISNRDIIEEEMAKMQYVFQQSYGVSSRFPIYLIEYRHDGTVLSLDEHKDFETLLGQPMEFTLSPESKVKDLYVDESKIEAGVSPDMTVYEYIAHRYELGTLPTADAIIARTSTTFKNIKGLTEDTLDVLKTRLEEELAEATNEDDKFNIRKRLQRMTGAYADITVGGENEWDIKRKKDAVEDCAGAIKAAISSKVCGGMSTLIPKVNDLVLAHHEDEGEIYKTILQSITTTYFELTEILLSNAGIEKPIEFITQSNIIDMNGKNPHDFIREAFDARKIIDLLTKGEEVTPEKVISKKILNTVDAEKKILEASMGAVLTLIGINQIILPDDNDVFAYKNDNYTL